MRWTKKSSCNERHSKILRNVTSVEMLACGGGGQQLTQILCYWERTHKHIHRFVTWQWRNIINKWIRRNSKCSSSLHCLLVFKIKLAFTLEKKMDNGKVPLNEQQYQKKTTRR